MPSAEGASVRSREIAHIAGVSVRALRHYHAIGLLAEPKRSANGYRDYDMLDLTRTLRIKRLASLGFSLARIKEMLDEEDDARNRGSAPAATIEYNALSDLDRELELQIEQIQRQRTVIKQLRQEQLDPSLPVRFARTIKQIYDNLPAEAREGMTDEDHAALLLAAHFYDDASLDELERFAAAAEEQQLLGPLYGIEKRIVQLHPDASEEQRQRIVDEAMALLDPLIGCFDPRNWIVPQESDKAKLIDSMMKEAFNPAQHDVEVRIENAILDRMRQRIEEGNGDTREAC